MVPVAYRNVESLGLFGYEHKVFNVKRAPPLSLTSFRPSISGLEELQSYNKFIPQVPWLKYSNKRKRRNIVVSKLFRPKRPEDRYPDNCPNGHHPEWTQSRMDTIPKGHNPERTPSRMDTIPNGHNPEWTPSRMDTIPNGHHPEWTPSRMDTIPNGHNPEWTPSRMDTIPKGHNPE